jgi:hypothetical protein
VLDGLIQQFAGGGANSLEGEALHGGVAQMMQGAENQHGVGAFSEALGALGGNGFGQSVAQGAVSASQEQRNGLAGLLTSAISQGGGSPGGVLSQLGIGGQNMGPQELGTLAQYVGDNHPGELSAVMGNHFGSGGGSGMMSLLGNPMVRQVGMSLAKRLV